jgi:hypothetical protein
MWFMFLSKNSTYLPYYISSLGSLCSIKIVLILHLNGKFSFSSLLKCENKSSESCVVITAQNQTDIRIWVFYNCGYEEFYLALLHTGFLLDFLSCLIQGVIAQNAELFDHKQEAFHGVRRVLRWLIEISVSPLVIQVYLLQKCDWWWERNALSNCKELSQSWGVESRSVAQELPDIVQNPEVCFHIHESPPLVISWARWIQSIPLHPISLRSILILSHLVTRHGICVGNWIY